MASSPTTAAPRGLMISAVAAAGFFRLGRHWPQAGVVVGRDELSDDELEVLLAEPNLRASPAPEITDEDRAAELLAAVKAAITGLDPDGFDKDGTPALAAVRKAVPDQAVTKAVLEEAWAALKVPPPSKPAD